jgi:hypothetical protein
MTRLAMLAACALALLAACDRGGGGNEVGEDMVEAQANVADALDNRADALENRAEALRDQADMTRDWSTDKQEVMEDAVANGVQVDENVMNAM